MPQQPGYASTDPNFGLAAVPPPTPNPSGQPKGYASTDPNFGRVAAARPTTPPSAPPSRWEQLKTDVRSGLLGAAASPASLVSGLSNDPKASIMTPETVLGTAASIGAGAVVTAAAPVEAGAAGLIGVTKALPYAWRAGAGAARVLGAAIGGGTGAAIEGKPLTAPEGQPSISKAAAWQAALELGGGVAPAWLFNAVGRRFLASPVARQAVDYLKTSRLAHVEEAQRVLQQAQDALDAHAAARAATARQVGRSKNALAAKTEQVAKEWPVSEAAIQPIAPVPAHTPTPPAAGAATPPPGRAGHFTLPKPSPAVQQYLNGKLAERDAALGRPPIDLETPSATAPPVATPPPSGETAAIPPRPAGPWDANRAGEPPMAPVPAHTPSAAAAPSTSASVPPPGPNFPARAAAKVAEVVQGPAKSSKALLGEAVDAAAQSGPMVDISGVKRAVEAMHAKTRPERLVTEAVPPQTEAELLRQFITNKGKIQAGRVGVPSASPTDWRNLLGVDETHPLPGVLREIQDAPDRVPFAVAHQIKRNLNDAVNWAAPAKKQLQQITKGASQQVRGALRAVGHAPYEQATAAYADAAKLFAPNQLGAQISKLVETGNPERVVNSLVKINEPTKLQMLKEVLLHHGEQGGGTAGKLSGQQAWESLQSTVMYKHLIQPGIERFDTSVARMHPEFLRLLTDSPTAQQVYRRLQTINTAYKAAQQQAAAVMTQAAEGRAAARATKVGLQRQQRLAARGVEEARRSPVERQPGEDQLGRILTEQENAFEQSSLGKPQPSQGQQLGQVGYALLAHPGSPIQVASTLRLLARGPKTNDLIYWASLSDANTQQLVQAISSPRAADYVAALSRGVDQLMRQHGEKSSARTPPPGAGLLIRGHQPSAAAVPPPGPR